jgi:hypothetical protein
MPDYEMLKLLAVAALAFGGIAVMQMAFHRAIFRRLLPPRQ